MDRFSPIQIDDIDLSSIKLIDGEQIDCAIGFNGLQLGYRNRNITLVLTDIRLIRLDSNDRKYEVSYVSIKDIITADVLKVRKRSLYGLAWAGVSLFVAAMVWRIWDNEIMSMIAAVAIFGMGLYLAFDRLFGQDIVRAVFRTPAGDIDVSVGGSGSEEQAVGLANRLFQLKDQGRSWAEGRRIFSPR